MKTKTEQLIESYESGCIEKAISILSRFRIGITKEQKRTLEIAHECHTGHGSFYEKLGINTSIVTAEAERILKKYINNIK